MPDAISPRSRWVPSTYPTTNSTYISFPKFRRGLASESESPDDAGDASASMGDSSVTASLLRQLRKGTSFEGKTLQSTYSLTSSSQEAPQNTATFRSPLPLIAGRPAKAKPVQPMIQKMTVHVGSRRQSPDGRADSRGRKGVVHRFHNQTQLSPRW